MNQDRDEPYHESGDLAAIFAAAVISLFCRKLREFEFQPQCTQFNKFAPRRQA